MTLTSGVKLGPYEIVSPLGAGGMGEVYRARDTRLGRDVAVKVLPEAFARDAERLARFEQEARAVAALNHPNLLAIYDMGSHQGAPFLVTELLEGETLRERLRSGPLPVRKALDVAAQAAHGVAAAHEKGIIHRDLKPANIFLTENGRVKILDFGLAKLTQPNSSDRNETLSPTLTAEAAARTQAGMVLGTVGYMSPEQVRCQPVDARTDVFALGAILYEMLSGQRAFEKDSSADTMAAILKEDPPELAGEGRKISPAVERVVRRCLEKNPAQRFQTAQDLAFSIESLSGTSTPSLAVPSQAKSAVRKWMAPAAMALVALCLGAAGVWLLRPGGAPRPQPTYHQLTFESGLIYSARFGPGGQSIYYSAAWSGQPVQVYSTNPSGPESRPLNLANSALFAVSPAEMAISAGCKDLLVAACEGTLAVVPLSGGAPREIADHVLSADWTPDGSQMAVVHETGGKFRVEFPLGKVIYESASWINFLRISPQGNRIAFVQYGTGGSDTGWAVILDREGKQIARSPERFASVEGLAWTPSGKEVWCAASVTVGYSNAIHALSLTGKDRIVLRLPGMLRLYDISSNGSVLLSKDVWRSGMQWRGRGDAKECDLSWLDAPLLMDLSSDGQILEFSEFGETVGSSALAYMRRADGSPAVKLGTGYVAALSPDGNWVLATDFPPRLVLLPTGVGEVRSLRPSGLQQFAAPGWMPNGQEVYFAGNDGHNWRLYVQTLAGGAARPVTPPIAVNPQVLEAHLLSPDGDWVFARDLNGKGWLYPLGGGDPRPAAGLTPDDIWISWSSDGRTAYVYQDEQTHAPIFRVDLSTGKRQLVTTLAPPDPDGVNSIGPVRITADGKAYAYSYDRSLSNLYIAEGAK